MQLADFNEAAKFHLTALELQLLIIGPTYTKIALTCSKIAKAYCLQGDLAQAEAWIGKSHKICESASNSIPDEIAAVFSNAAAICYYQGDFEKSIDWLGKALSIFESSSYVNRKTVATTLHNMALAYLRQGLSHLSLELIMKALSILEDVSGANHPDTAASYNIIGVCLITQGDYGKSITWLKKALLYYKGIFERDLDDAELPSVDNWQLAYSKELEWCMDALSIEAGPFGHEDGAMALDECIKALAHRMDDTGEMHAVSAAACNNLAAAYFLQGEHAKSLGYLMRALELEFWQMREIKQMSC
jgi:tetratricopeptide (TPR) repeat protein